MNSLLHSNHEIDKAESYQPQTHALPVPAGAPDAGPAHHTVRHVLTGTSANVAANTTANRAANRGAPRLAVILVDRHRPTDSIECLESLLRTGQPLRVIVVVDDTGEDPAGPSSGSLARLRAWASGAEPHQPPAGALGRLTRPPLAKPIPFLELDDAEAPSTPPGTHLLTIIRATTRHNVAGGINLGLRHALLDRAVEHFWCLDSATVVERDAPHALLARLDATPRPGMCGTQIRRYRDPATVQQLNGRRFHVLSGNSDPIGAGQPVSRTFDPGQVARETDFVPIESVVLSRRFLETAGFLAEDYAGHFAEIEWALGGRGRFDAAFAHGAIVYRKEGDPAATGPTDQQLLGSRLRFYWRNFPLLFPLQYLLGIWQLERQLLRGRPGRAWATWKALLGLRGKQP